MLLVTGITGHSGMYFLQELINNNYKGHIRCVVKDPSEQSLLDNTGLNIETTVGDLADYSFVERAMHGIDTVLHIASIFYSVNVMKAAVKNNVSKAILVHTTGIYSKYKSASEEYKGIEAQIKEIITKHNSPIGLIYLRPTMIYGNVNDKNMAVFIKMVDKLRLFPVIDHGKSLLQPVNGRDLGKAYYQVLTKENIDKGDYILSGEKPFPMIDIFKLISASLNKKTTYLSVPLGLGVFMARCLKACSLGKIDYVEKVQRMGEDRSFSHISASRDFGYEPMPFDVGLELEVRQYLEATLTSQGVHR